MRLSPIVLMLSTLATPLAAQSSAPVEIGSRVRMRPAAATHSSWIVGTVSARQGDTVRIQPAGGGAEQVFRFGGPASLFVSRGQKSSPLHGAIVGTIVGVVAGGVIGFAAGTNNCDDSYTFFCFDPATSAGLGAVGGGGIGLVLGTVIGALSKHEIWGAADGRSLRPIVSTAHGRFGLGFSARF